MTCDHDHEELVLYFYDEVDDATRQAVEAQVASCAACRTTLDGLIDLATIIPRKPVGVPDDATLESVRTTLGDRLAATPRRAPRVPALRLVTVARWSLAAAAAVLLFVAGRVSVDVPVQDTPRMASAASISNIRFDSDAGLVRVEYETVERESVVGDVGDAFIQTLLGQALRDDADPVSRLRAVRALADPRVRPDPDVVVALEDVVASEENPATILQAMKALQRLHEAMPISERLRSVLLNMVQTAENTAVRMRALEMLTDSEVVTMEMARVLRDMTGDQNPYMRNRASQALDRMEESGALERLDP